MAEGSDSVPVTEEKQDGKIIWCGKRNKAQKKIDDEANRFFLSNITFSSDNVIYSPYL
jgi:hypothetical protein